MPTDVNVLALPSDYLEKIDMLIAQQDSIIEGLKMINTMFYTFFAIFAVVCILILLYKIVVKSFI